jgi:hypothetical protein
LRETIDNKGDIAEKKCCGGRGETVNLPGQQDCEPPTMSKGFTSLGLGSVRELALRARIQMNRRTGMPE